MPDSILMTEDFPTKFLKYILFELYIISAGLEFSTFISSYRISGHLSYILQIILSPSLKPGGRVHVEASVSESFNGNSISSSFDKSLYIF